MIDFLVSAFTDPITRAFGIVLTILFISIGSYIWRAGVLISKRTQLAHRILKEFKNSEAASNQISPRSNARNKIQKLRSEARNSAAKARKSTKKYRYELPVVHAWHEFDETLVHTADRKSIRNTVGAAEFFNTETLAGELFQNRFLALGPGALTAIGVLGTFVGLSLGLSGLSLEAQADVEELRDGIQQLISGASTAFATSLLGVLLSLLASAIKGITLRRKATEIERLQAEIDATFVWQAPEQSLVEIMNSTQDSLDSLNSLHERIGDQFQKGVSNLSSDIQTALTTALESGFAKLVESNSQQSATVFEELISKFSSTFEQHGATQAEQLGKAAQSLNASMSEAGGQLGTIITTFQREHDRAQQAAAKTADEHNQRMHELIVLAEQQHSQSTQSFGKILESLQIAIPGLEKAGDRLVTVSNNFKEISSKSSSDILEMSRQLKATAGQISEMSSQQERSLEVLTTHTQRLADLQNHLKGLAEQIDEVVDRAENSLDTLSERHQAFLESLRANVSDVQKELKVSVAAFAEEMKRWLDSYADTVSNQTRVRMDEWNIHSQNYASHMLTTARTLSALVDDMSAKENSK